ncbi:PHD finger protein EHD3-like [Rutidosis leptorrhynchoides]|uniref:PHD finger protein EHD3-like n=1 Tax=Rutidosis leptorrhynchoides TaxID=125765 RepID=UPI003A99FC50
MTYPESVCTSVMKESFDSVEASENQTLNSAKEHTRVVCSESIKQSEASTISELCGHAFTDVLNSDKFSELCDLLFRNFGVVNTNRILDVKAIHSKMKNGVYETSPILYLKDIQQVWTKLQQVGNEMVTLANSLFDKSTAHYKQFVRKSSAAEANGASNCHGCGEKADAWKCLVCDSCEEIYHLNCTELIGTQIPPTSWYCGICVSNGIGSPHDNCVVCDKLKSSIFVERVPTNDESLDLPNSFEMHEVTEESQGSKICFICKNEVNIGDNFRTCGHLLCAHKFYHYKCLTNRQLGVHGPCWYCPSCLCRRCMVDKDDDQIVLCDGCDQAYHVYCAIPQLNCVPKGSWFCGKCDRELKRIRTMKKVYETIQKKVKVEDVSEHEAVSAVNEGEEINKSGGLDMLVTAAKTLGNHEITDLDTLRNII